MKAPLLILLFCLNCLSLLSQSQLTPSVPVNGLVAWYPFNGNANDLSGNANNGTVNGATLAIDRFGNPNSAYEFNGAESITGSSASFPSGNSARSISFWYNAQNLGSDCCKQILGYGGGSCGQSFNMNFENIDIGSDNIGKYEVQGHCLAFRTYTSYPTPANNAWHHIAVTYDQSVLRFYNDGVLVFTSPTVSINTVVASKIFSFGKEADESGTTPYTQTIWPGFTGELDDIAIYNRALSESEVMLLYNASNTAPTDIALGASSISENLSIGTFVGTLTATDDDGGTMTYSLFSGAGSTDNASFTINGDQLKTAIAFDYETKSSYDIRIRVADGDGLSFEKEFTISVTDVVNESIPTNGLVAWYPFNGNASDESGNGNNGTVNGPVLTNDRFSKGNSTYLFDPINNNRITVPFSNSINSIQTGLSMSAWVYMEGGTASGAPPRVLELRGAYGSGGDAGFVILSNDNSNISRTFEARWYNDFGNNNIGIKPTSSVAALMWHNLTYTADGITGVGKFYIDGVLIDTNASMPLQGAISSCNYNNNTLFIGAEPNLAGRWGGMIDDIAIYNRALNESEVMQLYTAVKQVQVISFSNLATKTYGDATFALTATSNSGLPVSYTSSDPNVATVSGNTVTIKGAGNTIITATQAGDDVYGPAQSVQQTLTVNKAILSATADNKSRVYGDANPAFTITYTGFKNSETSSVIDTAPIAATTATSTSNVGNYNIVPSGGTDNNYSLTYVNGTLMISKSTLTATVDNKSRVYGDANPTFTVTYTGFKDSETASVIDTAPTATTTATVTSNAGSYNIVLTGGTDNNYSITNVNGTLTIAKATLTATADNKSRLYGDVNPAFTIIYAGFKNSETSSVIDTTPIATTIATSTSNVGTYNIVPTGGTDNNYLFSYVDGILTIGKTTLTVSTDNKSRTYGDANPTFIVTYTGFKNSETASVLDTAPNTSTTATPASDVGIYSVVPSGAEDVNYTFNYVNASLTINKATLNASADDKSRLFGVANPVFTITYSGFKNSDTQTVLDTAPSASTTATTTSVAGIYSITVGDGVDNNYDFTYTNGVLSIFKSVQTITFLQPADVVETTGSFTLNASASSGLPVSYSTTSTGKISIIGNVVTIISAGSITISATQAGNNAFEAAAQVSRTMCILPKKPTITSTGLDTETVILTSSSATGNAWYRNNTALSGATNATYLVDGKGLYTVKVSIDGCASEFSDPYAIIITDVIDQEQPIRLTLFPNPASQELKINLAGVKSDETSEMTVYDFSGKVITRQNIRGSEGSLWIEQYAGGNYLIQITNKSFLLKTRFIKY